MILYRRKVTVDAGIYTRQVNNVDPQSLVPDLGALVQFIFTLFGCWGSELLLRHRKCLPRDSESHFIQFALYMSFSVSFLLSSSFDLVDINVEDLGIIGQLRYYRTLSQSRLSDTWKQPLI